MVAPVDANDEPNNNDETPNNIVRATLVVAPVEKRATINVAPTKTIDEPNNNDETPKNIVRATLVVAPVEKRATIKVAPTNILNPKIGDIIGVFKSISTNEYISGVNKNIYPEFDRRLWQGNYHDHFIRNEESLNKIREYIINNPKNWKEDKYFCNNKGIKIKL